MSLYETFYETAVLMDRKTTASPVGGFISGWTEGAEFQAAFTGLTPTEKIAAQQAAVQYSDTIVTPINTGLAERDVFKFDGKYYRVIGKLPTTPKVATFSFERYAVESLAGLPT